MANNQNQNQKPVKDQLCDVRGTAYSLAGALFDTTTDKVSKEVTDLFLKQGLDHILGDVLTFPVFDQKSGAVTDIGIVAILKCDDGVAPDLQLSGGRYYNGSSYGDGDLTKVVPMKASSSKRNCNNFTASNKLLQFLSTYSIYDDNEVEFRDGTQEGGRKGKPIIRAIVDINYWVLSAIDLCCYESDSIEYKIIDFADITDKNPNNKHNNSGDRNYWIRVVKYPSKNNRGRKRNRGGDNYNYKVAYNKAVAEYSKRY